MNINDLFKASFGTFGSVYLNSDGAQLDLSGATANRFIMSITMMDDVTFQTITTLDGIIGSISTDDVNETQIDDAFGAVTNLGDNDARAIDTGHIFPKGVTIYGKWDFVELNSGSCLCYLAPVGY
tara:strand:+ start:8779 stop:9153 length:375 start_codon:yes stop_codon:yes gene_type:complete